MAIPGPHLPSMLSSICLSFKGSNSLETWVVWLDVVLLGGSTGPWRLLMCSKNLLPPRSFGMCWPS